MLLTMQVVLPYMQSKLESIYNKHRRQARAPLGLRVMQRPSDVEMAADQVFQEPALQPSSLRQ